MVGFGLAIGEAVSIYSQLAAGDIKRWSAVDERSPGRLDEGGTSGVLIRTGMGIGMGKPKAKGRVGGDRKAYFTVLSSSGTYVDILLRQLKACRT